jgi:hypothetical protein
MDNVQEVNGYVFFARSAKNAAIGRSQPHGESSRVRFPPVSAIFPMVGGFA